MDLIRWNPAREMFNLRNRINSMFDDFFFPARTSGEEGSLWSWNPVVDIYEDKDSIVIKAELPGVDKDKIAVDVKGRVLTLKGERVADNEVSEDSYYRRERVYGKFERAFTLPVAVDPDKIKAEYKDGVLKVEIPKPEEEKPKQIAIDG